MSTIDDNMQILPRPQFTESRRPNNRLRTVLMCVPAAAAVIALGIAIHAGIKSRASAETELAATTLETAVPTVQVVHPQISAETMEISLPGLTQAYVDSPIYARTNGYLKSWFHDIGAHVKKGQLLAVIETPEVDQQLWQARADLDTARANATLADVTAKRFVSLKDSGATSQEQIDSAVDSFNASKATVDSNAANVSRLEQLASYEKVYAPFDGVVTVRNTDIGDLINAGAGSPTTELFHMVDDTKLRIFVAVPEVYSSAAQIGASTRLTLDEYPGQSFQGTIVRDSNAIDLASRTLNVEVDVANSQDKLLPGAYVFVHFKIPQQAGAYTIPVNTLIFRSEGLQVGVVEGDRVELHNIKLGRDYGSTVEVVSGLTPSDAVIVNPSDSLTGGSAVRVK